MFSSATNATTTPAANNNATIGERSTAEGSFDNRNTADRSNNTGGSATEDIKETIAESTSDLTSPTSDDSPDDRDASASVCNAEDEKRKALADVSVFTTVRDLFLTSFCDGYCKDTFCFDGDFFPSCPTTPSYYRNHCMDDDDESEYECIVKNNSGVSGLSVGGGSRGRRSRPRPLAVAVGFHQLKDKEGRQVVITPAAPRKHANQHPPQGSTHPSTCTQPANGSRASTPPIMNLPQEGSREGSENAPAIPTTSNNQFLGVAW